MWVYVARNQGEQEAFGLFHERLAGTDPRFLRMHPHPSRGVSGQSRPPARRDLPSATSVSEDQRERSTTQPLIVRIGFASGHDRAEGATVHLYHVPHRQRPPVIKPPSGWGVHHHRRTPHGHGSTQRPRFTLGLFRLAAISTLRPSVSSRGPSACLFRANTLLSVHPRSH